MAEEKVAEQKKMITEIFCKGLVKGWNICVNFVMPNIVMSFILIKFLEQSGLLKMIGDFFGPAMAIFGLPGEAATVLMAAWLSQGGGVGVAAAPFKERVGSRIQYPHHLRTADFQQTAANVEGIWLEFCHVCKMFCSFHAKLMQ